MNLIKGQTTNVQLRSEIIRIASEKDTPIFVVRWMATTIAGARVSSEEKDWIRNIIHRMYKAGVLGSEIIRPAPYMEFRIYWLAWRVKFNGAESWAS